MFCKSVDTHQECHVFYIQRVKYGKITIHIAAHISNPLPLLPISTLLHFPFTLCYDICAIIHILKDRTQTRTVQKNIIFQTFIHISLHNYDHRHIKCKCNLFKCKHAHSMIFSRYLTRNNMALHNKTARPLSSLKKGQNGTKIQAFKMLFKKIQFSFPLFAYTSSY